MASVQIVCLLGRVSSPNENVEIDVTHASPNSSRWIFEVVQDTAKIQTFDLSLLDRRSDKPRENGLPSITFTPMDREAAGARLRSPSPDTPQLTLEADRCGQIKYRVTVDVAHSLVS